MPELTDFLIMFTNVVLAATRMGVALYTVPFIHQNTLVPMVRNTMIFCFMIPVLPLVMSYHLAHSETTLILLVLAAKEALLGLIIGFLVGVVFWATQSAGAVIDMQRGAFFATMQDPLSQTETTPLGSLLIQLAAILFFVCGGFREMIGAILGSYTVWPVDRFFPHIDQDLVFFAAEQLARGLNLAVIIAAPIVISAFISDLALGVLNRFAPQMNVFMISLPVKSTIASSILVFYIFFLLKYMKGHFMGAEAILQVIKKVIQ